MTTCPLCSSTNVTPPSQTDIKEFSVRFPNIIWQCLDCEFFFIPKNYEEIQK